MAFGTLHLGLSILLAVSCACRPSVESSSSHASGPSSSTPPAADRHAQSRGKTREPPRTWAGAAFDGQRISVSLAENGAAPRVVATEASPRRRTNAIDVTDVAYDIATRRIYVGTCCEPGSGHLWHVDPGPASAAIAQDDQGFAADVAGSRDLFARADAWGTLVVRLLTRGLPATPGSTTPPTSTSMTPPSQDIEDGIGVADVAIDAAQPPRVLALLDSTRLRAVNPTAPAHARGLLIRELKDGAWHDETYSLPEDELYCRVVPMAGGRVGLLAGALDAERPPRCTGDRLDIYDPATRERDAAVLTFTDRLQHVSMDESSTFLIATTVDGAVGWRALDGRGGVLADRGFVAADW